MFENLIFRYSKMCEFCAAVRALLDNPYQYSGQVIAKLSVNAATMMWSVVVLLKDDALARWPGNLAPARTVNEDVAALVFLVLSVIATARVVLKRPTLNMGACIYGMFLALWLYTWITLAIAVAHGITAARPGQIAGVSLVLALAIFAFVSSPKRGRDGSPSH